MGQEHFVARKKKKCSKKEKKEQDDRVMKVCERNTEGKELPVATDRTV